MMKGTPPHDIILICNGLTDRKTSEKIRHAKNCTATRHLTAIPGSLLTSHDSLVLPGSHILHPLPLFNYKGFSEDTVAKLLNAPATIDNEANIRSTFHSTPQQVPEAEIIHQLFIPLNTTNLPTLHSHNSPAAPSSKIPQT